MIPILYWAIKSPKVELMARVLKRYKICNKNTNHYFFVGAHEVQEGGGCQGNDDCTPSHYRNCSAYAWSEDEFDSLHDVS